MAIGNTLISAISKESKVLGINREINAGKAAEGILGALMHGPKAAAASDVESRWAAKQAALTANTRGPSVNKLEEVNKRWAEKQASRFGNSGDQLDLFGGAASNGRPSASNFNSNIRKELQAKRGIIPKSQQVGPRPQPLFGHAEGIKLDERHAFDQEVRTRIGSSKAGFVGPLQGNNIGVKAAPTTTFGALGKGLEAHLADLSSKGFGHQMSRNIGIGAGLGLAGGLGASVSAAIDPEHFQSNGVIKPMMQGAFKGAMLGAAHAAGSSMTRAQVGDKHGWINRTGRMVQNAAEHKATKGALAMVALADGGNTNFTKPSNPLK